MLKIHIAHRQRLVHDQHIHIQWLAYEKSVRNLGKETMDTIVEIILDTDHSGHDCTLERL